MKESLYKRIMRNLQNIVHGSKRALSVRAFQNLTSGHSSIIHSIKSKSSFEAGCNPQARRKSAREKRKQRLHVLMDFWAKRGIPPFIDALLKNAPPPEDDDFPDEVHVPVVVLMIRAYKPFGM